MVGYMSNAAEPTPGRAPDNGWKVGVRTTVAAPAATVWEFLLGEGLPIWLGRTRISPEKGAKYETDDDIRGTTVSFVENFRVRLTWQPGEWDHDSQLQLTLKDAAPGTTIEFEHSKLTGREERKIMLGHWKEVLGQLDAALAPSS
jgi:uncharacterized protein YndB with AHSA1/START domain